LGILLDDVKIEVCFAVIWWRHRPIQRADIVAQVWLDFRL